MNGLRISSRMAVAVLLTVAAARATNAQSAGAPRAVTTQLHGELVIQPSASRRPAPTPGPGVAVNVPTVRTLTSLHFFFELPHGRMTLHSDAGHSLPARLVVRACLGPGSQRRCVSETADATGRVSVDELAKRLRPAGGESAADVELFVEAVPADVPGLPAGSYRGETAVVTARLSS